MPWYCSSNENSFLRRIYSSLPKSNQSSWPRPAHSCFGGKVIDVTVEFSDELFLETSGARGPLPTLSLNNGGEAVLVGGTGSSQWLFSYDFLGGNGTAVSLLDVANYSETSPLAINCTAGCRAANWNGAEGNLSVSLR